MPETPNESGAYVTLGPEHPRVVEAHRRHEASELTQPHHHYYDRDGFYVGKPCTSSSLTCHLFVLNALSWDSCEASLTAPGASECRCDSDPATHYGMSGHLLACPLYEAAESAPSPAEDSRG